MAARSRIRPLRWPVCIAVEEQGKNSPIKISLIFLHKYGERGRCEQPRKLHRASMPDTAGQDASGARPGGVLISCLWSAIAVHCMYGL